MNPQPHAPDPAAAHAADGFDLDWLGLREPLDTLARERERERWGLPLLQAWAAQRVVRPVVQRGPLRVLDLGSGSGANLRYLAPRLGGAQRWCLVDHDPRLLAAQAGCIARWAAENGWRWAATAAPGPAADAGEPSPVGVLSGDGWQAEVMQRRLDLATDAESLRGAAAAGIDLLTASALLDLLSAPAIERLLALGRRCGAAMLWALNVDGRRDWQPADADDPWVAALFTRHQQRDKGFGPALGPAAGAHAADGLRGHGWRVHEGRSDWWLDSVAGPAQRRLLAALVEGDAGAALAQAAAERDAEPQTGRSHGPVVNTAVAPGAEAAVEAALRVNAWSMRRAAALAVAAPESSGSAHLAARSAPGLRARIGHVEVLALPPDPAPAT
jgi:SAM-dependent methyltransferase